MTASPRDRRCRIRVNSCPLVVQDFCTISAPFLRLLARPVPPKRIGRLAAGLYTSDRRSAKEHVYEMIKALLRILLRLFYRFSAYNLAVLNTPGPVLLIPNHVSWLDWAFVGICLEDDWKFVVSSVSAQTSWLHRKIMLNKRTFPIDTMSPYAAKHMAEYLGGKGRLVLFAEGRLSRTGTLMKLFDGTGFLLHKTEAKVITCYLRGAHRLPFSPNRDKKKLFPRVTAHFSELFTPPRLEHISTSHARAQL